MWSLLDTGGRLHNFKYHIIHLTLLLKTFQCHADVLCGWVEWGNTDKMNVGEIENAFVWFSGAPSLTHSQIFFMVDMMKK